MSDEKMGVFTREKVFITLIPVIIFIRAIIDLVSEILLQSSLKFVIFVGVISFFLGIWSLVSARGYLGEEEWGYAFSLMTLSFMVVFTIADIITWILVTDSFNLLYFPLWVKLCYACVGFLGFFSILTTSKRYD